MSKRKRKKGDSLGTIIKFGLWATGKNKKKRRR